MRSKSLSFVGFVGHDKLVSAQDQKVHTTIWCDGWRRPSSQAEQKKMQGKQGYSCVLTRPRPILSKRKLEADKESRYPKVPRKTSHTLFQYSKICFSKSDFQAFPPGPVVASATRVRSPFFVSIVSTRWRPAAASKADKQRQLFVCHHRSCSFWTVHVGCPSCYVSGILQLKIFDKLNMSASSGFCRCGSKHLVFVYGTLKSKQPNHHLLEKALSEGNAKYIGVGKTVRKFPLVVATQLHIPFMLACPDIGQVWFPGKLSASVTCTCQIE